MSPARIADLARPDAAPAAARPVYACSSGARRDRLVADLVRVYRWTPAQAAAVRDALRHVPSGYASRGQDYGVDYHAVALAAATTEQEVRDV